MVLFRFVNNWLKNKTNSNNTVMFLIFLTRQLWANSVDLEEQSDQSTLLTNPFVSFWAHYSMVEPHCSNFRIIAAIFRVSEF